MMADRHDDRRLQPHHGLAHRPRPQRGGAPLPPVVHAVDPDRPGADRRLLRLRRVDLGGLLRHARRPHRRVRGGGAVRRRRAGRRSDDVLRPRLERLELHRAADARARAAGRADPARTQLPPLDDQRDQGVRARLPLPPVALRRGVRGGAAAVGRPGRRRAHALPRGARGRLHLADLRGAVREHARDRRGGPRRLRPRDAVRGRGVGRASPLPPGAAALGDGRRRRHLRAVDPQARGRAAADGADPLARGARGLRADGGGVPRVRHDQPQLPPAGLRRRGGPLARRHRAGGARRVHRPHPRAQGAAARAAAAPAPPRRSRLGRAPLRPRRRLRQGQDHRRAERLRAQRLRGLRRARRARHRGREGGRQHDHPDHHLPARGGRGRGHRRRARGDPRRARAGRRRDQADARQPVRRDRRPARDAPVPRPALREVDRPGGPARPGGRARRRRGGRGLPAGHPRDPRGLPGERGRRPLPPRGA